MRQRKGKKVLQCQRNVSCVRKTDNVRYWYTCIITERVYRWVTREHTYTHTVKIICQWRKEKYIHRLKSESTTLHSRYGQFFGNCSFTNAGLLAIELNFTSCQKRSSAERELPEMIVCTEFSAVL